MKKLYLLPIFLYFSVLMLPVDASDLFTYQGKLTDASGSPLYDGQYRLGVRIWESATGGTTPLWARKYQVPVSGGVFSLMIGSAGTVWDQPAPQPAPLTTSLKLAVSGSVRYVEITVMSDANGPEKAAGAWQVLLPRQSLTAVPYAMNGVPTGTVVSFAGTVAPDGWVLCNGADYSRTDARFAALFAGLQTTYGSADGASFRVPDLRGRTAIGAGQGPSLTNRSTGQTVGTETHTLTLAQMPAHDHNVRDNGHQHTIGTRDLDGDGGGKYSEFSWSDYNNFSRDTPKTRSAQADIREDTQGSGQPHNIMQPSLVLNYIIKL